MARARSICAALGMESGLPSTTPSTPPSAGAPALESLPTLDALLIPALEPEDAAARPEPGPLRAPPSAACEQPLAASRSARKAVRMGEALLDRDLDGLRCRVGARRGLVVEV